MTEHNPDKPLAIKLNLRDGQVCWFDGMPEHIIDEIDEYAYELRFVAGPSEVRLGGLDAVHLFVTEEADLTDKLSALRSSLAKDGQIWVSWKSASNLDQNTVQSIGVAAGYLNTKTIDLDDIWSAMKFVIPKAER
ncbi:MAG: DUF3052 family protein [Erythrobacter sp.]